MAHIHTEPGQYDQTVSAYIVRIDGDEPRMLLHKHKKLGIYLQIGGHVELDENPWQAISHELVEETGYNLSQLQILQPKQRIRKLNGAALHPMPVCINSHLIEPGHYHTDSGYAFITNQKPADAIQRGESTIIKWFTRTELAGLSSVETPDNVKEVGLFIFQVCLKEWQAVDTAEFKL